MNEIVSYIGAAIAAAGGVGAVLVLIGRFSASFAQMRIKAREAESADRSADAETQKIMNEEFRSMKTEFEQFKVESRRKDTLVFEITQERDSYKAALDQSILKLQQLETVQAAMQDELAQMKSGNAGLVKQVDALQTTVNELQATLDREVVEKAELAAKLKDARETIQHMEQTTTEREHNRAIEVVRTQGEISALKRELSVYRDTNDKLIQKIQPFASDSVERSPEAVEKSQESSETLTQE